MLTEDQQRQYETLANYYPFRMFFLAVPVGADMAAGEIWCFRDKRAVNKALREGTHTIHQIHNA